MTKLVRLSLIAAGILLGIQANSRAALITVMDQIGPNPTFVQGQGANSSQIFESSFNTFNIAVVDNFSITAVGTRLTEVDAALLGFNGFTTYANVTGYQVAIYSSATAAVNSGMALTGDVFNTTVAPAAVSLTTPYGTDAFSALVKIPVSVALGLGNYFIAVIPDLAFSTGGQLGVYESTFAGTPGGSNAFQVNPGGGFGFPGNSAPLGANAAYRILAQTAAVPEPSSMVILSSGLALAFYRQRRARASRP